MHHASPQMQERVFAAYTLLMRSIRNRDAHAYRPDRGGLGARRRPRRYSCALCGERGFMPASSLVSIC
jgi:hypothetical protein